MNDRNGLEQGGDAPAAGQAARILLDAARRPTSPLAPPDEEVLEGRGLDWDALASYLVACGVARPLLPALDAPTLRRLVPPPVQRRLRERALRDGLREALQRDVVNQLAEALTALGEPGVLLKGGAFLVLGLSPRRTATDIDLWVGPTVAPALRARLLERGFAGAPDAPWPAPHHLAPVSWRGVSVEIHLRLMPRFWGLPEPELLGAAMPVAGLAPLGTLTAEGLLLHAAVHASAHLFTHGLKTGWDLALLLDRSPELDWEAIGRLAARTRLPRAFWVPLRVLARDLDLPVPAAFLGRGPADGRQERLELIARHRFYAAVEGAFDLNPWTKTAVFLLLHDTRLGAARYLGELLRGDAREARATGLGKASSPMGAQLRQAVKDLRWYRRAVARAGTAAPPDP